MNAADNTRSDAQDSAAILSAQASLAADNQPVAPVLRYAPGEEPLNRRSGNKEAKKQRNAREYAWLFPC
jgi:hypothetical protein